jgi:Na+/H+ antiporter NhaC
MYVHLAYIIIISFIISITVITFLGITAEVSNNNTSFNETSINKTQPKNFSSETCVMPKCPNEKVCIQVCPESLPPV